MGVSILGSITAPATTAVRAQGVAAGGNAPAQVSAAANPGIAAVYHLIPNQDHVVRLAQWGISSPGALAFWGGGGIRRFLVSLVTGIPTEVMRAYAQEGELAGIPGMQPDWARLLYETGIRSPIDLYQYSDGSFGAKAQLGILWAKVTAKSIELSANEGRPYSPPTLDDLGSVAQASVGLGGAVT